MDDTTLANYIPSYGDRIALFNFCKGKKSLPQRKHGLLEKLRDKMKVRQESTNEDTTHVDKRATSTTRTKKLKTTRNVELGWIHSDKNKAKQVRGKQGGGTRIVQLENDAGLEEILQVGKKLFFPGGISP